MITIYGMLMLLFMAITGLSLAYAKVDTDKNNRFKNK